MTTQEDASESNAGAQVAVIGMAGRFPGAGSLAEYWKNLCAGVESVKFFTDAELLAAGESLEQLADPAYVRAWPVLADIDRFDAAFFGMSPRDAAVMDPQHRLFLEVAWSALEHAGYDAERTPAAVGVFAACGMNTYMMYHLVTNQELMETVGEWLIRHTGNDMNFLATRVSYQMNLKGPALNVQTACSSALVGIHLACQSLLNGECDMALAGASTVSLPQDRGYLFKQGEILSPDGHCRPFDAASSGTLFGSGLGCLVLKRLDDAIADDDQILAVICGSAINNDGSQKVGYLAPSVDGQARAVAEALAISGVSPESISYIEAHGTGTSVGDPIEVTALTQAYRAQTDKKQFVALGSVKGNIGHLGEAAGMAGIIKTILGLNHRQIPPSINYQRPNPEIDFENSPFFVSSTLREWRTESGPLRAGVTALGAGGTNVHLILEQPPQRKPLPASSKPQLLLLSAKTSAALERATEALAAHLEQHPELDLADVAHTLQVGRKQFSHRRALVADDLADAVATLRSADPKRLPTQVQQRSVPSVAFMFPGGGAQYATMGAELYRTEPAYRSAFDECLAALPPALATRVRGLVLSSAERQAEASTELERPSLALPALFATEYATAKLLMAWGVKPVAFIGHSMGEYVAAALSGVFSPRDGMLLVATRGRLFETLPPGGMLSVELPEAELRTLLGARLSIAAVNGPQLCVASGPVDALDALERELTVRDVGTTRIHIAVAAHSQMLAPILAEFEAFLGTIRFGTPSIPFVSNLSGRWVTTQEVQSAAYWLEHLRSTVRFADGLAELLKGGDRVLLEIGPGRTLSSLSRQQVPAPTALPTLRHPQEALSDVRFAALTLGRLWLTGAPLDFELIRGGERRRRVPLPSYSFEPQRYWVERGIPNAAHAHKPGVLRKKPDITDWFGSAAWKRAATPEVEPVLGPWLIFSDQHGIGERVAALSAGEKVIQVVAGDTFMKVGQDRYTIRPDAAADYQALVDDLMLRELFPNQVVYAWPITAEKKRWSLRALAEQTRGVELFRPHVMEFFGPLFLAQTLGAHERALTLSFVSTGLHQVAGDGAPEPEKALLFGPTRVIPREFPTIWTRSIDVSLRNTRPEELDLVAEALRTELRARPVDGTVALRSTGRWVQSFEPLALGPSTSSPIRQGGVYLITGGLGGIGLELAEHLARTAKAKLVLLGRTGLPARTEWQRSIAQGGAIAARLRKVQAIEALGGEVLSVGGDVSVLDDMRAVATLVEERFGALHGIVHSAGIIDDGLISLKTKESAEAVLAVKVKGARVLEQVFGRLPLDFVVLFSSVSSVLGLEGQIDYTAANAFLDSFATANSFQSRTHVVSVGWNAWREIGMAVALAEQPRAVEFARVGAHPCLERVAVDSAEEVSFVTSFSRTKHWLLAEHIVHGAEALLPGTSYLELARAGLEYRKRPGVVEIRDVTFMTPFVVGVGESRELRLRLQHSGQSAGDFAFFLRSENEPCVAGHIEYVAKAPPPPLALDAIRARVTSRELVFHGFMTQSFMDFGPRWANVERIRFAETEALISLALPEAFALDLTEYPLHPALLDMATGGAQSLIPGFDQAVDFFVPFAYGRVTIHRPLTPRVHSHVRYKPSGAQEIALFDVDICDDEGNVLVEIVNFTMRRVAQASAFTADSGVRSSRIPGGEAERAANQTGFGTAVRLGISNSEGFDALERILSARIGGHLLATSVDIRDWLAEVELRARPARSTQKTENVGSVSEGFSRPSLSADFLAPRNDIERELAGIWRELLGLSEVGVKDDFFELGGQSLVAVRLFNKIRKRYGVSLPLSTLFEAPTIAGCAQIIAEELGVPLVTDEPAPLAPLSAEGPRSVRGLAPSSDAAPKSERISAKKSRWASLVVMQPQGEPPPFFCVAGLGGTLNNLRKLAILTGGDRPMYGLQPPGADDPSELLYSVEELADHYLREVKSIQPSGPYFLGGYSGGGITAFEMCRRLTAEGESIAFLGLIDSYSPELPMRPMSERVQIHLKRLSTRGPRTLLDSLGNRLIHERYEMTRHMTRGLRRVFPGKFKHEHVQDSWLVAQGRYRPPAWDGKATLFRARELGSMSLWSAVKDDEQHGWSRYLLRGVDVQFCPGDHNTMCDEPNVRVLAAKLRESLRVASGMALGPASVKRLP